MKENRKISRLLCLELGMVAFGVLMSACTPSQVDGSTAVPTTSPKDVLTETAVATLTAIPTESPTLPLPSKTPELSTPTPDIHKRIDIPRQEIEVGIPEVLRQMVNEVKVLTHGEQEAYINVNGEQALLMVKTDGKWIPAPYGLGLPNKDGNIMIWKRGTDGQYGFEKPTSILNDTPEVAAKKEQVLGLIEWMKTEYDKSDPHPETARMYLPDLLNFGMRVKPESETKLWQDAMQSIYESKQSLKDGYWDTFPGGRPASFAGFLTKLKELNYILPKFEYMSATGIGTRTLVETNSANVGELNIIVASEKDVRENILTNIIIDDLYDNESRWIGDENHSQRTGFGLDVNHRLVLLLQDTKVSNWNTYTPGSMGRQTMSDLEGNPVSEVARVAETLTRMVFGYNKNYIIEKRSNYVPYKIIKASLDRIFPPVVIFDDVRNSSFEKVNK